MRNHSSPQSRAVFLVLLCFVANCAGSHLDKRLDTVNELGQLRWDALALVNDTRAQEGLSKLRMSDALNRAAQAHAEDMARRNYYSHRSMQTGDVASRYRASGGGRWTVIGENIASCRTCDVSMAQVRSFHQQWLSSPGHRRNILRPDIGGFGFGMASAEGQVYAVQTFVGEAEEGASVTFLPLQ